MESELLSVPVLAAIAAIVVGLGKVIELLILRALPSKSILVDEERDWIQHTYKVVSRQDSDGTPLVYVPPKLGRNPKRYAANHDSNSQRSEENSRHFG